MKKTFTCKHFIIEVNINAKTEVYCPLCKIWNEFSDQEIRIKENKVNEVERKKAEEKKK